MQKGWGKRFLGILPTLILFFAVFWFSQPHNVLAVRDWWVLLSYDAPQDIESFADELSLTEEGKRLLFAAKPEISDAKEFNKQCESVIKETNKIFGCYVNDSTIYVYDIPAKELETQVPVTLAHELLHAAYARLSSSEREKIDQLLQQQLQSLSNSDLSILDSLDLYEGDSGLINDEAHSFLGSEAKELSFELESYYARYFKDRSVVVGLNDAYTAVFEEYDKKIEALQSEIESIKGQIQVTDERLDDTYSIILNYRSRMEAYERQGDIESRNELVGPHNEAVARYKNLANQRNALVADHNKIVKQLNLLIGEQQELIDSTNSTLQAL